MNAQDKAVMDYTKKVMDWHKAHPSLHKSYVRECDRLALICRSFGFSSTAMNLGIHNKAH